jgi:hypothetical protein
MADEPYPDSPELFDEEGDSMAFGLGIGDGVRKLSPNAKRHKSAAANPYYYYPGFAIGYLIKAIGVFLLARAGGVV